MDFIIFLCFESKSNRKRAQVCVAQRKEILVLFGTDVR